MLFSRVESWRLAPLSGWHLEAMPLPFVVMPLHLIYKMWPLSKLFH